MRLCIALCLLGWCAVQAAQDGQASQPFLTIETGGHRAAVTQVLFSRDGNQLITVSLDKTIRIQDVRNQEPARVLRPPVGPGGQGELFAAALSPDGKTLAVGGFGYLRADKRTCPIFLFSLPSGEITGVLRSHGATVRALAFAPVGNVLASGGRGGAIILWDPDSGKQLHKLAGHKGGTSALAFAPDGKRLASVGNDKVGRIWSVETGKSVAELKSEGESVRTPVDWSRDGKHVATGLSIGTGPFHGSFALWGAGGKLLKKVPHPKPKGRLMACRSLRFTPSSKQIVETCTDKYYAQTVLYDVATGEVARLIQFENHLDKEVAEGVCAISPNGKLLAVADDRNHLCYLFRLAGGKLERKVGGKGRQITGVGWVSDKERGPAIVWRNDLRGQEFEKFGPFKPIPPRFFQRCFRLGEMKLDKMPEQSPQWHRYAMGVVRLQHARWDVDVFKDKERIAVLRTPGEDQEWALYSAVTLVTPERAVVSKSTGFYCLDTKTGKRIHTLRGHNGVIRVAAPSPGKPRLLLAGGDDQVLHFWNAENPTAILSLFVAGVDWVAWTPQGYYAATPGGERLMGWVVNNGPDKPATFHPASRFRKQLYRPELIPLVLEKGDVKAALETLAAKVGKPQPRAVAKVDDLLPPSAVIESVDTSKLPRVTIKVKAAATRKGQPVVSLRLLMNGRPIPDDGYLVTLDPGKSVYTQPWTVEVPEGKTELSVLVRGPDSMAVSAEKIVEWNKPPDARLFALCIGVDKYAQANLNLKAAGNDARAIAAAIEKRCGKPLFASAKAKVLRDEKATKKGILESLAQLRAKPDGVGAIKATDLLVVFFAGHGVKVKDEFYLLPHDAKADKPEHIPGSCISGAELRKALTAFPCQRLLLLDACHSGAAGRTLNTYKPATDDVTRVMIDEEVGVVVLAAAKGDEYALEERQGKEWRGYFASAVEAAIKREPGVHCNFRDKHVYVHHLHSYVFDRVKDQSGDEQHPSLDLPSTVDSFPLVPDPGQAK